MEVPAKLSLSYVQFQNCSRALEFFNEKLQNHQLRENEFDHLQDKRLESSEFTKLCTVALHHINLEKNRYDDIIPFDSTRVVLNSCKDNDHINESFIKFPIESSPQFIAAQGPLQCTCDDFWEMVLQYRCPAIVMLTCLVDQNQVVKCDDYFQEKDGPRTFGDISVITKQTVKTESSLVLRFLEVTKAESEELPLSVLHIHYLDWPDHSVPEDTLAIREILKRTYSLSPGVGPIVVHCSAGVGRTGTYCVIHDTIQRIVAGDMTALDVVNTHCLQISARRNGPEFATYIEGACYSVWSLRLVQHPLVHTAKKTLAVVAYHAAQDSGGLNSKFPPPSPSGFGWGDQFFFCHEVVVDALEELISGYNAENKLSSSSGNGEDVETQRVRKASDETHDALEELISGYNAENKLSSNSGNGEDVETQRVRKASDETHRQVSRGH